MPETHHYVQFSAMAGGAEIRTATFGGRPHVIVPVVAMVGNSVVWPMNAKGAEFVPAEELAVAPGGWNGRPCLPLHPSSGTLSANDPATLEAFQFGMIFNARFDDTDQRLKMEAWLDPERAAVVGADASAVIERCLANQEVEVSVGAWILAEKTPGVHEGKTYESIWRGIIPDHLALLPEGTAGACSVEMGCGAPRVASARMVAAEGVRVTKKPGLMARMGRMLEALRSPRFAAEEGMSDAGLRDALYPLLRATVPAFDWIVEVFPDDSTVIFMAFPEDRTVWYRQSFSIDPVGAVTLNDDREQVEPIEPPTEWRPVTIAEAAPDAAALLASILSEAATTQKPQAPATAPAEARTACRCQDAEHNTARAAREGEPMADKVKLAGRLIANAAAPFDETDRPMLEAMADAKLQSLADSLAPEVTPVTEPAAPAVPVAAAPATETAPEPKKPEPTEDEVIAALPKALQGLIAKAKSDDAAKRTALVAGLKSAQAEYDEAALEAKSTVELESLARMLRLDAPRMDYSGRPIASLAASESDAYLNPPDPYALALAARNPKAN